MKTIEVVQNEWLRFLDEFSKQHEGENATMELIGEDIGVQLEGRALPFVGISLEKAGSEKNTISVILGTEPDKHLEHRIYGAEHLRVKIDEGDERDALEIEAADGIKTILQLQPVPMLS